MAKTSQPVGVKLLHWARPVKGEAYSSIREGEATSLVFTMIHQDSLGLLATSYGGLRSPPATRQPTNTSVPGCTDPSIRRTSGISGRVSARRLVLARKAITASGNDLMFCS